MKKIVRFFVQLVVVAVCVVIGLTIGPTVRGAYQYLAPGPAYITGDFSALHRDSGAPVVLFSTSTCPHCKAAREWLDAAHIDYRDFVLDESADARKRFKALGGDAVPTLFIGDRRIVGFREDAVRDALASIGDEHGRRE